MPEEILITGSLLPRRRWKDQDPNVRITDPMDCPNCGRSISPQPISYGLPDAELADAAERGEVHLGGCRIFYDFPSHRCRECGYGLGTFGSRRSTLDVGRSTARPPHPAQPQPQVVSPMTGREVVTYQSPCTCPLCFFVATRGWAAESHDESAGPCSDPYRVDCRCPGTKAQGEPCEACATFTGSPSYA